MYAKIFSQILDSSIARDPNLRRMFQDLLILADSDGVVDMTFFAISQRLVIPEDEIRLQIDKLCKPDPQSRSKNDDGRRLIKIDESREWGWLIVNYVKYANTRDEDSRKKQVREAVARHRAKKPPSISTSCNHDVINVITNDYSNHDVITVSHGKPIHAVDVSVSVNTEKENILPETAPATLDSFAEKPARKKKEPPKQLNGYNPITLWIDAVYRNMHVKTKLVGKDMALLNVLGNMYDKFEYPAMLKAYEEIWHKDMTKPWSVYWFYTNRDLYRSKARPANIAPDPGSDEELEKWMRK